MTHATFLRLFAVLSLCLLAPSCAVKRIPFPIEEYESLPTEGTGRVTGQAFLKTRGGDVKTAAGEEISLFPVTSYSEQWWEVTVVQGRPMEAKDPRYDSYIRTCIGDVDGNFEFVNIPPGEYFLSCVITWEVPSGGYIASTTGGVAAERITVDNDTDIRVILTR